jgi:hypothetical protein
MFDEIENNLFKEYFLMITTNKIMFGVALVGSLVLFAETSRADYDLSPSLVEGKLVIGGLSHEGDRLTGPVSVLGFDFGEEEDNPYNLDDPGICQNAGFGDLIEGARMDYTILSSLCYWDGTGDVNFVAASTQYLTMANGGSIATITGTSGVQPNSYYVDEIGQNGFLHVHIDTSLFGNTGTTNISEEENFLAPANGIYAFQMALTMTDGDAVYTSDPIWIVWNNGMGEEIHDAAMAAVPEPITLTFLAIGGMAMLRRRNM